MNPILRFTMELEFQSDSSNPDAEILPLVRILHIQASNHHHPSLSHNPTLSQIKALLGLSAIQAASLSTPGATATARPHSGTP